MVSIKKYNIKLIENETIPTCTKGSLDDVVRMLTKENYTILS